MPFKTISSDFGNTLKINIWGGSHEAYVGGDITGFPPGISLDFKKIESFLKRRSPGLSKLGTSPRFEADKPIFTKGLHNNTTTGGTISFKIENSSIIAKDYESIKDTPRPGHADYPAKIKYGNTVNLSGGGPFSGRLTAPLCVAGAIAMQYLEMQGIQITSRIYSISDIFDEELDACNPDLNKLNRVHENEIPCINKHASSLMLKAIEKARKSGDSLGSAVEAFAFGLPVGLGSPMYQGIESIISPIVFGIPAVKALSFGAGTKASYMNGSSHNDAFFFKDGNVETCGNNHGGILGGLSTGMPINLCVYFKPTPSISKEQKTVNLRTGEDCTIKIHGRHDTCIGIRALPAVEAALALGLCDIILGDLNEAEYKEHDIDEKSIVSLRKDIDSIDKEIALLLLNRLDAVSAIGKIKREKGLDICDSEREEKIKNSLRELVSQEMELRSKTTFQSEQNIPFEDCEAYVLKIFESIMKVSKDVE